MYSLHEGVRSSRDFSNPGGSCSFGDNRKSCCHLRCCTTGKRTQEAEKQRRHVCSVNMAWITGKEFALIARLPEHVRGFGFGASSQVPWPVRKEFRFRSVGDQCVVRYLQFNTICLPYLVKRTNHWLREGEVVLDRIELREDAFDFLNLPVTIRSGGWLCLPQ